MFTRRIFVEVDLRFKNRVVFQIRLFTLHLQKIKYHEINAANSDY